MIERTRLQQLPPSARDAITAAEERVQRAVDANDVEATVGASKELIETVAKAVMDALGSPYGSNASLGKLAAQTLDALKLHPSALQGRTSLQRLSSSLVSAAQAIAELRNTDGTGHGRAARSNLDPTHGVFIRDVAGAWCYWILTTARRALTSRAGLDEAVSDISGARVFSRGDLPAFLAELGLAELGDDDQRKLGLAVARRWSVNQTFNALLDVIEPLATGQMEQPPAFREGVLEGLLLDNNGYMRLGPDSIRHAVSIGVRLPGDRIEGVFRGLADRVEDAQPSYAFDGEAQDQAAALLRVLSGEQDSTAVGEALDRMARRIEGLRQQGSAS